MFLCRKNCVDSLYCNTFRASSLETHPSECTVLFSCYGHGNNYKLRIILVHSYGHNRQIILYKMFITAIAMLMITSDL